MPNDIVVTYADGSTETFIQDNIVRPRYDCSWSAADYVSKVLEIGVTTETVNPVDGTVTTRKISPHCMCEVTFVRECNAAP